MAETVVSVEVRWFWKGDKAPQGVKALFEGAEEADKDRIDLYLMSLANSERNDLGIKARDGKNTEIRFKLNRVSDAELSPSVIGHVETWIKWSISTQEDKSSLEKL